MPGASVLNDTASMFQSQSKLRGQVIYICSIGSSDPENFVPNLWSDRHDTSLILPGYVHMPLYQHDEDCPLVHSSPSFTLTHMSPQASR